MTEIKGQYLYNLKTGQTIGRNKDDVKTSEDKNQYSVNGVKHNWETYQLLNDISNVIDYDYGTVEDLRLSQIVQLFAQGDMTVDELQIGLKSKKVADINITENNGITTVTFTYEGKKYTLKCSTDAAKSQIDDVKDDATKNVTIDGGTTTPATPDSRALSQEEFEAKKNNSNFYNYNGEKRSISIGNVAWVTYSDKNQPDGVYGASLPELDIGVYASELEYTPEYIEDNNNDMCAEWSYLADLTVQICDKLGIEYTDRQDSYEAILDKNRLTKEQGQYINSHPEEFFGMKINYDENGEYQRIYLGAYYDLYCYSKYTQNSDFMNIKDVYWSQVDKFSKSLQMNQGTNLMTTPECDGNTVTFTDESIEMIKEMLMKGRGFDNEHHAYNKNEYGFVQLLGLNQNSSEEEIRQKIADFCYKAGSTDGKTILVEDYYNALAVAKVGISGGSLSNIDLEIPLTYDEISRNINNALYLKIEECERLGIDISDLGITKPSQFIKINASEAFNATGLMNGGVKDERYSNRFYNDDVTKPEDPWIDVPEDYKSPDGDTSGVGYFVCELKEKYPDIYEKFKDVFPEYGNGHGQSRSINICITNNRYSDNQDFRKLLMYAAGVSESEVNSIYMNSDAQKINEKVATALGGIVDGPYIASDIEFDVIDLMNYLLGKNDTGTNYFYSTGIVSRATSVDSTGAVDEAEYEYVEMGSGGISISSSEISEDYATNKKAARDNFKNYINNNSYLGLQVNSDDTITFDDNFIQTLKQYMQDNLVYSGSYIAVGGGSGLYSDGNIVRNTLTMLGIPYQEMKAYAEDESKLKAVIESYCKSLGSNDGKTVTLEAFFNSVGENKALPYDVKTDSEIYKATEVDAYIKKLGDKYPTIADSIAYTLNYDVNNPTMYFNVDGSINLGLYFSAILSNELPNELISALKEASGINDTDSVSKQEEKLLKLAKNMGSSGSCASFIDCGTIDILEMTNYLLGDNSSRTNYLEQIINKHNAALYESENKLNALKEQEPLPTDSSIETVRADALAKVASKEGEWEKSALSQEISSYIYELIDPIYTKYFGMNNYSDSYNPYCELNYEATSEEGGYRTSNAYTWKKEEFKQDYINEVEAAIQKILEKYSDDLTSITFDGWYINFTTKDDSTFAGPTILKGDTNDNGRLGRVAFVEDMLPAIDTPRIYSSAPSIVEKNYPEKAPVYYDIYLEENVDLYKTPWDGVLVDLNGGVYLYDVEKERYVKGAGLADVGALATGDTNALNQFLSEFCYGPEKSENYCVARLVLCNIYGYNLTTASNIFEKDGKYYQLDTRKSTSYKSTGFDVTSPENFISLLSEVEFVGTSTPATQNGTSTIQQEPEMTVQADAPASSAPQTSTAFASQTPAASVLQPEPEVTVVDTPDVPTAEIPVPEVEQPVTPTVAVEEKTITKEEKEEVIIKSEDIVSEMQTAAEKLNLTAAKTTGTYYQFSANGSYLHVWNPETKKFKAFSINTRNADGTINQEFTQTGKAVNRTEANVYYEALLEAYKNGYNFTVNYPWVCEKDGVCYEYDKEAGCFKKRTD